ncbi:hypothetical protein XENOCAPTIV_028549 [Xenoophorus captivus]|uniref:Uncharacterized protein n=1 Tax=Xenoophorus captivus TaxID=1517983 RepID=A0ABV0R5C5_9TELE
MNLADWKKYSGSAFTSDDEPTPSDDDEGCPTNKDQPHLRFEITSDDGFSVEADSVEGNFLFSFESSEITVHSSNLYRSSGSYLLFSLPHRLIVCLVLHVLC